MLRPVRWPVLPSGVSRPLSFLLVNWQRIGFVAGLLTVLVVADVFTGYNMFHYPQYELDEGTYVGAAWAMIKHGQLFYYTYTYSHPPLGWLLIGIWSTLAGGFTAFGMAINGGRLFMLVVTLISSVVIYLIIHDVTRQNAAALFGALVFVISPLGVGLHRQVYLDNIGTLFLLLSILLLARGSGHLSRIVLSGAAFGLAFWSKETFAIFFPALIFLAYVQSDRSNRRFSFVLWTTTALSIISLFVLLAFLKDELLPPGMLWSASSPHVSLLGTYSHQAGRGGNGDIFSTTSDAWVRFRQWQQADPVLLTGGLIAAGIGLLLAYWNRFLFGITLLILCFVLFFGRGGIVLYYYVIPLLALLAIAIGVLAGWLLQQLSRWRVTSWGSTSLMLALTLLVAQQSIAANSTNFNADRTTPQYDAAKWIVRNVPNDSVIIMDSYPWVDFRDPSFTHGKTLIAHYYWPALSDPQIRDNLLHDDWHNIDYLLISPNSTADAARSSLPLLSAAIQNSDQIANYASGNWNVKIMRIRKLEDISASGDPLLQTSWNSFKKTFVVDGRVVNPLANNWTTSSQQADAMLQAVYVGDRGTYTDLWNWAQSHLERNDDHLMASQWGVSGNSSAKPGVIESNTSANADETMALSLLLASKEWSDPSLLASGKELLRHIWNNETSVIGGRRILVAGNWAGGGGPNNDNATINPSYFMPYAYRIFAAADPSHPWMNLVDSSYDVLQRIHQSPEFGGPAGLFPDWVSLSMNDGKVHPATLNVSNVNQAAQAPSKIAFNISVDWIWNHDSRALTTLQFDGFIQKNLVQSKTLLSAYNYDGSPASKTESLAAIADTLPALLLSGSEETALKLYATKVLQGFDQAGGMPSWGSHPNDVKLQTSVWFAASVMDGGFADLWSGRHTIDWKSAFYH